MLDRTTDKFRHIERICGRTFIGVGLFSAAINLLMLAVPLYMLQVYDRVLSTRSADTLIVLTVMAVVAIAVMAALEAVRGRIVTRVGLWLDAELAGDMLASGVGRYLAAGGIGGGQELRDLTGLRNYLAGPGLVPLFDTPFLFVFIAVIFLIHPLLGWIVIGGAVLLFVLALLNEVATRRPVGEANAGTTRALNEVDTAIRNADTIVALGMLDNLRRRWDAASAVFLGRQRVASDRSEVIGASTSPPPSPSVRCWGRAPKSSIPAPKRSTVPWTTIARSSWVSSPNRPRTKSTASSRKSISTSSSSAAANIPRSRRASSVP